MPGAVLNGEAQIICPHGGKVIVVPKQFQVLVGGAPALASGDLEGSVIVECPIPATPLTSPCLLVATEIPEPGVGQSIAGLCAGRPLLLEGIQALTNGRPPGLTITVYPGQVQVIA
ncbi:MAG TPA: hypothetical protein VHX88_05820 [Solirubrobacteraceae bacterium]|jgi:hypothetical protein|nr:hypothetical protein [Solirubrobacteraceae bacterium]